jgi:hypothetical protein
MESQESTPNASVKTTAIELSTETISEQDLQLLIAKQIDIWNSPDQENRLSKMKKIYLDEVAFFDHEGTVDGLSELNERISKLQEKFAGFKFSLDKTDASYNAVRYYWNFGPESNPVLIGGMDLIILKTGRIRSLNVYLDRLPPKPVR